MTSTSIWQLSTTASSNTAIAGINIAENCAAANINDAIRELCAEVVGALKSVQATGTADALLASITPAPTALVDGMVVFVRAAAANATTAPTFVLNSIGPALTITQFGGQAVGAGAIAGANHELILRYVAADPTNPHWELLNPAAGFSPGGNNAWTGNETHSGSETYSGATVGTPQALSTSGAVSVNLANGNNVDLTLTGNVTSLTLANATAGQSGRINIIYSGGAWTVSGLDAKFKFPNGTAPTFSSTLGQVDKLVYDIRSSTAWDANLLKNFA